MKTLLILIPILLPAALLLGGGLICVATCTTSTTRDRNTVTKFDLKRYKRKGCSTKKLRYTEQE